MTLAVSDRANLFQVAVGAVRQRAFVLRLAQDAAVYGAAALLGAAVFLLFAVFSAFPELSWKWLHLIWGALAGAAGVLVAHRTKRKSERAQLELFVRPEEKPTQPAE